MTASLATVSYIGATILFILSLGGLSSPASGAKAAAARREFRASVWEYSSVVDMRIDCCCAECFMKTTEGQIRIRQSPDESAWRRLDGQECPSYEARGRLNPAQRRSSSHTADADKIRGHSQRDLLFLRC